jgi:Flp pilus assembly pilin Flp
VPATEWRLPKRKLISRLYCSDEGAALAEYGLLAALIAVVLIAVTALGTQISTVFSEIASAI